MGPVRHPIVMGPVRHRPVSAALPAHPRQVRFRDRPPYRDTCDQESPPARTPTGSRAARYSGRSWSDGRRVVDLGVAARRSTGTPRDCTRSARFRGRSGAKKRADRVQSARTTPSRGGRDRARRTASRSSPAKRPPAKRPRRSGPGEAAPAAPRRSGPGQTSPANESIRRRTAPASARAARGRPRPGSPGPRRHRARRPR